MGNAPTTDLLTIAAPALLLIWTVSLIALAAWRRRIRSAPVAGPADIISKATRSRQHARAMIAWHTLGALTITAAFGLLSWPSALAAAPLLIPQKIPSCRAILRAVAAASSSFTCTTASMISTFKLSGMKPAPIP